MLVETAKVNQNSKKPKQCTTKGAEKYALPVSEL